MRETAILILAAGESRRMGRPKQTLPVGGQTLLSAVIHECLNSKIGQVFLVTGAHERQVRETIPSELVKLIHHPGWKEGMGSSLAKGVEAIVQHSPATEILLVLGDQYKLTAGSIQNFIDAFHRSEKSIGISVFEEGSGPPAIFMERWFPELLNLTGDEGAKPLVQANRQEVLRITLPEAAADMDTPEDYRRLSQP